MSPSATMVPASAMAAMFSAKRGKSNRRTSWPWEAQSKATAVPPAPEPSTAILILDSRSASVPILTAPVGCRYPHITRPALAVPGRCYDTGLPLPEPYPGSDEQAEAQRIARPGHDGCSDDYGARRDTAADTASGGAVGRGRRRTAGRAPPHRRSE